MKRVLLICQDTGYNVGWSFRRLLPELGLKVVCVNEEGYFGSRALFHRLFRRMAGAPPLYWRFNRDIIDAARTFRPDMALFIKSPYVAPKTLRSLKEEFGIFLTNYSLDDWFSLNPKAVSSLMRECIPLWDLMVTTKRYNVPELQTAGARRAVFVRCGYDPLVHHPVRPTPKEHRRWQSDLLFVGTFERDRAEQLQYLCERVSPRLRVHGGSWPVKRLQEPLRTCVTGTELVGREKLLAFGCTKIGLAFLRKVNRDTYTDRSFEIPACGAFMLAERSAEHALLYQEDKEIACFASPDELADKVRYYLTHEDERQQIAEAGYQRVIAGKHTYKDRLIEILNYISRLGEVRA